MIFDFLFKKVKQKNQKDKFEDTSDIDYSLLSKESRKRSDYYYSIHQQKLKNIDITNVDRSKIKPRKLSSIELNFLKYLNNRNVDNLVVAGYWTHEYNINYKEVIPQFICQGLLEICDSRDLSSLKVVELKDILLTKNLPRSGKKNELIQRIRENFSPDELTQYFKDNEKYYRLTPKGKEAIKNIKPSATMNLELEDKCYKLILAGKFNEAYKKIAKYESQKPIQRGLGIDWRKAAINGLHKLNAINYIDHLNLTQDLPVSLLKHQKQINAAVILGDMLGVSYDKICKMFLRITNIDVDKEVLFMCIHTNYNYLSSKKDLLSYLEDGVEKYQILTADDSHTCPKCARMHDKIFKVREAEYGISFPPFCDKCRCTTVPYFEE
jgi:SPP1 gp7 family putative phage head morphogenesis protein